MSKSSCSFTFSRVTERGKKVHAFTAFGSLGEALHSYKIHFGIPPDHSVSLLENVRDPKSFFVFYDDVPEAIKPSSSSSSSGYVSPDGKAVDMTFTLTVTVAAGEKPTTSPSVSTSATPSPSSSSSGSISPTVITSLQYENVSSSTIVLTHIFSSYTSYFSFIIFSMK